MLFISVQDMPTDIVIDLKSPNGQSGLHILNFGTFLQHANHIHNTEANHIHNTEEYSVFSHVWQILDPGRNCCNSFLRAKIGHTGIYLTV